LARFVTLRFNVLAASRQPPAASRQRIEPQSREEREDSSFGRSAFSRQRVCAFDHGTARCQPWRTIQASIVECSAAGG